MSSPMLTENLLMTSMERMVLKMVSQRKRSTEKLLEVTVLREIASKFSKNSSDIRILLLTTSNLESLHSKTLRLLQTLRLFYHAQFMNFITVPSKHFHTLETS
jgi:hypothetical protein